MRDWQVKEHWDPNVSSALGPIMMFESTSTGPNSTFGKFCMRTGTNNDLIRLYKVTLGSKIKLFVIQSDGYW